ncbi:hypothetical protein JHD52_04135 [Lactobacillus sp. CRM56-2]|nr:hypothetical protein [Lactobacillus sp. CRM56-2]
MTTVILAEKPSQARSYVQAFQKSDEFTIEVQQMIKKKTHSLSPCKI